MKIQSTPVFTRSLCALSLGCALAALPLSMVRAQEVNPPAPTTEQAAPPAPKTAGEVDPDATNKAGKPMKAKPGVKSTLTIKEKAFMRKAAGGNAAEVQLAELALKKSENAQIKEFAQMMITDHTAANKDLLQLASDEGLANFKAEVRPEDKAIYAKMTSVTGTAFDSGYVKHAVSDHETDVKEYKEAQAMTKNAGLKAYVDKVAPIVEGHLKQAKELDMKKTASN